MPEYLAVLDTVGAICNIWMMVPPLGAFLLFLFRFVSAAKIPKSKFYFFHFVDWFFVDDDAPVRQNEHENIADYSHIQPQYVAAALSYLHEEEKVNFKKSLDFEIIEKKVTRSAVKFFNFRFE